MVVVHTARLLCLTGSLLYLCRADYIYCLASYYFKSCKTKARACPCEQGRCARRLSPSAFTAALSLALKPVVVCLELTLQPRCYGEEETLATRVRKLRCHILVAFFFVVVV